MDNDDVFARPGLEALEPRLLASASLLAARAAKPVVSVADATVREGTGGTTDLEFVFTRRGNAASLNRTSVVNFATRDGDGGDAAVAPDDYAAKTGRVTFKPGQTTKTVRISVAADDLHEGGSSTSESMRLRLTDATDARIPDTLAVGTIDDDDRRPRISIADTFVLEGDAGSSVMRFTVRLTNPSQETVSVDYATANGTASAGVDFTAANGTLTFTPGQSSLTVDVTVANNLGAQGHRDFDLVLSDAVGAAIVIDRATGTIIDDEGTPVLLLTDVSVTERDSGERLRRITVRLSHAAASPATVFVNTEDATAKAGDDYDPVTGTLTFPTGITSADFSIPIFGDTDREPDETFNIVFSSPVNIELIDTRLAVSVVDND